MEKKEYVVTEEKQKYLDMLKDIIKNDTKFAYALHTSFLAKRMRSWGYKAMAHLPKKNENYNWMDDYPCGDYDRLVFTTMMIHYPEIYKELSKEIPSGYVEKFISDNLYPLKVECC